MPSINGRMIDQDSGRRWDRRRRGIRNHDRSQAVRFERGRERLGDFADMLAWVDPSPMTRIRIHLIGDFTAGSVAALVFRENDADDSRSRRKCRLPTFYRRESDAERNFSAARSSRRRHSRL